MFGGRGGRRSLDRSDGSWGWGSLRGGEGCASFLGGRQLKQSRVAAYLQFF